MSPTQRLLLLSLLYLPGMGCSDDGSATPQQLVAQLQETKNAEAPATIVALVAPKQRAILTYTTASSMRAMFRMSKGGLGLAAMVSPDMKGLMDRKPAFDALLKKHGIGSGLEQLMAQAAKNGKPPTETALNEHLGHADHATLLRELVALFENFPGAKAKAKASAASRTKYGKIAITGDTATVEVEGKTEPIRLLQQGGRWYLDIRSMLGAN